MNENQKKLIDALAKINFKELVDPKPVFPEQVYAMYKQNGLTAKEIAQLEDAEMLSQLVELLPNDEKALNRLYGALDAVSGPDAEANKRNLLLIAQKDPQMLVSLLALAEVSE